MDSIWNLWNYVEYVESTWNLWGSVKYTVMEAGLTVRKSSETEREL